MAETVDWAWFAGLFEGEGCILFTNKNSVRLAISSTDHDVLSRAQAIAGGSVTGPYEPRGMGHKVQWEWRLNRTELIQEVLAQIEPYMGERRLARINEATDRLAQCRRRKLYKRRRSGL